MSMTSRGEHSHLQGTSKLDQIAKREIYISQDQRVPNTDIVTV